MSDSESMATATTSSGSTTASTPALLVPIEDIVLAGIRYRLARNGKFSLHHPQPPDAFGVVAHVEVKVETLDANEVDALIQLLGAKTEELQKMRAAVSKKD